LSLLDVQLLRIFGRFQKEKLVGEDESKPLLDKQQQPAS